VMIFGNLPHKKITIYLIIINSVLKFLYFIFTIPVFKRNFNKEIRIMIMQYKHLINKITLLIYFTIISFNWCFGQDNFKSKNEFGWLNLGLGASSFSSFGSSLGINVSYQIRANLISFRYVYNAKFKGEIFTAYVPRSEKIRDFGVLYGLSTKSKVGFASISGGISIVSGVRRGEYLYKSCNSSGGWFCFGPGYYEKLRFTTVGIPIEAQVFITGENAGIGIYVFANINPESSFFGALLSLQLGKLR